MRHLSALALIAALTLTGCGAHKYHPTTKDFQLSLRVTSRHCFGTEGCTFEFKVEPRWVGPQNVDLDGDYDVTYAVRGGSNGPELDTMTLYKNGSYTPPPDGMVDTPDKTPPTVAVQSLHKTG